jgi:histidinol-phosphatase (PHP family)
MFKEGIATEYLLEQFDHFLAEAHHLKAKYADRILLLVGLETEYVTSGDLDHLEALLSRYPGKVQYLVGSVHHVNEIPIDFDLKTFEKALVSFPVPHDRNLTTEEATRRQVQAFLCSYFDSQYEVLTRFRPEVVGHIDLCRLYNPMLRFEDYPQACEKLKRNIDFAVEYGALFELNAAALRKGWTAAYPGDDVVEVGTTLSSLR